MLRRYRAWKESRSQKHVVGKQNVSSDLAPETDTLSSSSGRLSDSDHSNDNSDSNSLQSSPKSGAKVIPIHRANDLPPSYEDAVEGRLQQDEKSRYEEEYIRPPATNPELKQYGEVEGQQVEGQQNKSNVAAFSQKVMETSSEGEGQVKPKKRRRRVKKKLTPEERAKRIELIKNSGADFERQLEQDALEMQMLKLGAQNEQMAAMLNGFAYQQTVAAEERKQHSDLLQTKKRLKELDEQLVAIGDRAKQFRNVVSGDIVALFSLGDIRNDVQLKNRCASFAGAAGNIASGIPVAGVVAQGLCLAVKSGVLLLQARDYQTIRSMAPSSAKRDDIAAIIASELVLALIGENNKLTTNKGWFSKTPNMEKMSKVVKGMLLQAMANKIKGVSLESEIKDASDAGVNAPYAAAVLSIVSSLAKFQKLENSKKVARMVNP